MTFSLRDIEIHSGGNSRSLCLDQGIDGIHLNEVTAIMYFVTCKYLLYVGVWMRRCAGTSGCPRLQIKTTAPITETWRSVGTSLVISVVPLMAVTRDCCQRHRHFMLNHDWMLNYESKYMIIIVNLTQLV